MSTCGISGRPREEIEQAIADVRAAGDVRRSSTARPGIERQWNAIQVTERGPVRIGIRTAPTFRSRRSLVDLTADVAPIEPIRGARVLALLGDSVTTDHISPAGSIAQDSPAGRYLVEHGVHPRDFNSYGSRRGNDRVMVRGTFANIRIRNQLAPGTEGGWTRHLPDGEQMTIYDAAQKYREEGRAADRRRRRRIRHRQQPGLGRQRDLPAGRASRDRRQLRTDSPQQPGRHGRPAAGIPAGETWQSLGLTGEEVFDIPQLDDQLQPRRTVEVRATVGDGSVKTFPAVVRIDTPVEMEYYRNGGILQTVLRKLM